MSSRSTTRNAKPGVMKMSVSRAAGCQRAAARRRLERAQRGRADRDDAAAGGARARRSRRPWPAPTSNHSLCMRCSARFSVRTGWKVPAPTCSVTRGACRRRARAARRAAASSKCSAAVGAATAPGCAREHGLVAALVVGAVGVRDVGRQRHVAVRARAARAGRPGSAGGTASRRGPARPSTSASKASREADRGCPAFGDLLARRCASTSWPRQHALDQRLDRAAAGLAAEQPRLDDARVVEDQQVARRAAARAARGTRGRPARRRVPSSRREPLRSAAGCCAISSGGSAKSKSLEREYGGAGACG